MKLWALLLVALPGVVDGLGAHHAPHGSARLAFAAPSGMATRVGAWGQGARGGSACSAFRTPVRLAKLHEGGMLLRRRSAAHAAKGMSMMTGGAALTAVRALGATPDLLFQSLFLALVTTAAVAKIADRDTSNTDNEEKMPAEMRSLQIRFLSVFWMMRMADWLQGPYFYEVYASKVIAGAQVSLDMVSKFFLVGFGVTGLLGPVVGKLVDNQGRRAGTIAFALLYTIGALSTKSSLLWVLLLGRVAGGIGTSLLGSAPESWLVGEHSKGGFDGKWLGQTFGLAYAGDSLVAISAGQLAGLAAAARGPCGPFEVSVVFLAMGALLALSQWKENVSPVTSTQSKGPTVSDAFKVILPSTRTPQPSILHLQSLALNPKS